MYLTRRKLFHGRRERAIAPPAMSDCRIHREPILFNAPSSSKITFGEGSWTYRVISVCEQFYGMRTPHLIGFRSQRAFRRISGNVRKLAL